MINSDIWCNSQCSNQCGQSTDKQKDLSIQKHTFTNLPTFQVHNHQPAKSTNHTTVQSLKRNLFHPYLGNLDTPIQQQLGSNVVLVLMDIVEEAPMRHQLCDQLDGGTQADAQQADQVGVLHASHNQGLLNETEIHSGMRGKGLGMDDDTENSSQQILHSQLF